MINDRLCLGTVQFGLSYGIYNRTGKPSRGEVFKMIDEAVSSGIRYIDTAAAYGNAEEILGEYLSARSGAVHLNIISKLKPNLIEDNDPLASQRVRREVESSLKRLKTDVLEGYLLHTPANFYNQRIIEGLIDCKEAGLIKNLGVSIYEMQEALDAAGSGLVDYIQVPYSVFDQRVKKTDFFQIAKRNKVKVFSRSTFLQGLMLMSAEEVPVHLAVAKTYLGEFDDVLSNHGLTRLEASFLFSYNNPEIDCLVFGVDNLQQLRDDLSIPLKNDAFDECLKELETRFQKIDKSIIFPSLWAQK